MTSRRLRHVQFHLSQPRHPQRYDGADSRGGIFHRDAVVWVGDPQDVSEALRRFEATRKEEIQVPPRDDNQMEILNLTSRAWVEGSDGQMHEVLTEKRIREIIREEMDKVFNPQPRPKEAL